jgi:hypothetical protein
MDSGDGKRNLVLYAKKGATDLIRANLGISTTKLTKDVGDGYVAWIAEGRDKTGRTEQAVGSASTQGLKGQHLASAVMIAQTRATRRMTLQFVGGGLLDESELNETTADINRAPASLASMATLPAPQPIVVPNTEAGKDITLGLIKSTDSPRVKAILTAVDKIPAGADIAESFKSILEQYPVKPLVVAPEPFSSGTITPQPIPGTEPLEPLVQIEAAEPKRRRRRTKAEMEASRNNVTAADDFGTPIVPAENPFVTPDLIKPSPELIQVKEDELKNAMQPLFDPQPPFNLDYPTSEQEADYRKRLQTWVEILKTAGMTGGINWRLKRYTLAMFPDAVVDNGRLRLTSTQWDALLADFDKRQYQDLVAIINSVAEKA